MDKVRCTVYIYNELIYFSILNLVDSAIVEQILFQS